jgi:hypothetical protein
MAYGDHGAYLKSQRPLSRSLAATYSLPASWKMTERRRDGWYHTFMVKTTVYLDEREAAALRRIAAQTGRSQASLIRDAIAQATASAGGPPRRLASAGAGSGSGEPVARNADEILRRELGRSPR